MPNVIDLKGQSAAITGGAQGIGRAIAERFIASGARVALWDADLAFAERTAKELGANARAVGVDVTDYAAVEKARDATLKAFGRIDILVNNAGISGVNAATHEYPLAAWAASKDCSFTTGSVLDISGGRATY